MSTETRNYFVVSLFNSKKGYPVQKMWSYYSRILCDRSVAVGKRGVSISKWSSPYRALYESSALVWLECFLLRDVIWGLSHVCPFHERAQHLFSRKCSVQWNTGGLIVTYFLSSSSSLSSSSCSWKIRRVSCSLILKMKLVPPSLPRSSYVSSSFWFIL